MRCPRCGSTTSRRARRWATSRCPAWAASAASSSAPRAGTRRGSATPTTPPRPPCCATTPAPGRPSTWATAPGSVDVPGVQTHQVTYTSADGTPVRMFLVAPVDAAPGQTRPTVLYGYGGFGLPLTPGYSAVDPRLGRGRWRLGDRRSARRRRGGRGLAPRRDAGPQAERLRRLPRSGRVAHRARAGRPRTSWRSRAAPTADCWSVRH